MEKNKISNKLYNQIKKDIVFLISKYEYVTFKHLAKFALKYSKKNIKETLERMLSEGERGKKIIKNFLINDIEIFTLDNIIYPANDKELADYIIKRIKVLDVYSFLHKKYNSDLNNYRRRIMNEVLSFLSIE